MLLLFLVGASGVGTGEIDLTFTEATCDTGTVTEAACDTGTVTSAASDTGSFTAH